MVQSNSIKTIVHRYYDAWARQDQKAVRELIDEDLDFRSPQDRFRRAEDFLGKCWIYSQGLARVQYLYEVYTEDQAFVILSWAMEDGGRFADAEYVRTRDGRIAQIIVVNNSPEFGRLLE